ISKILFYGQNTQITTKRPNKYPKHDEDDEDDTSFINHNFLQRFSLPRQHKNNLRHTPSAPLSCCSDTGRSPMQRSISLPLPPLPLTYLGYGNPFHNQKTHQLSRWAPLIENATYNP